MNISNNWMNIFQFVLNNSSKEVLEGLDVDPAWLKVVA
jgi:hypothetical protein